MYLFAETGRNIVEFHSNNHTWVTRGLTHKHMAREVQVTKQLKRVLDVVIGMFYSSIRNGMLNDHIHLLDIELQMFSLLPGATTKQSCSLST